MKIIIVKQRDLKDCGCCCLQSIIKYYQGFVPLEKIRSDTCTDSGGTTAYHIIESAKKYGFDCHGKRVNFDELQNQIFPLIAHVIFSNGYAHYVVIYKIKNNKVIIMDPAKGKVILTVNEFKQIWSNIIIIFHPKNRIINLPKNVSIHIVFFKYIYLFKNKYILFILINILLMIFTLINSLYLSYSLKTIKNFPDLLNLILFFLVILIFKNIISYIKGKLACIFNYLLDTTVLKDFIKHMFLLPLNILQNRTTGEMISRVNELNNVKNLFTEIFLALFLDSVLLFVSLTIMGFINLKIMVVIIIFSLIYGFINVLSIKPLYSNIRDVIEKDSLYNESLIENVGIYNTIKNLDLTDNIIDKTNRKLDALCASNLKLEKNFNFFGFVKDIIYDLILFFLITIILFLVINKRFDLSDGLMTISIFSIFFESLKNILNVIPKYNYFKASFEKISEFYSLEEETETKFNINFKNGEIIFKNISVSFDNYHKLIRNINFKLKNKSHTLLMGDSGIGKSTLLKCLLNPDYYTGDILISNINIKDYSLKTLRKNIVYAGQNDKLFSDTIYNNITCNKKVKIERFYKVCSICLIDEIIKNKPLRYMSQIDDSLTNLSGGERQKIILARTLLTDAKILVLDEVLSEVDYDTEIKIIKSIREFFSNKTIIYVSHKNVKNCFESIIYLNKGGV